MGLTAWIEVGHARADHGLRLRGAARDRPAARAPGPAGGHAVTARRGWPIPLRCGVRHRRAVGPGRSCAAFPTCGERGTAMRPRLLPGVVLGVLTLAAGGRARRRRPPDGIILDMDSSESPTFGQQEGSGM